MAWNFIQLYYSTVEVAKSVKIQERRGYSKKLVDFVRSIAQDTSYEHPLLDEWYRRGSISGILSEYDGNKEKLFKEWFCFIEPLLYKAKHPLKGVGDESIDS